jgi:hypothetical protein
MIPLRERTQEQKKNKFEFAQCHDKRDVQETELIF